MKLGHTLFIYFLFMSAFTYAQGPGKKTGGFIEEVYSNLNNIDITILPYISRELIVGAESDTGKYNKLVKYLNGFKNRSSIESRSKFICLLNNALNENTKRLYSAQLDSDPFSDYYNAKGFGLIIDLTNNYSRIKLEDDDIVYLLNNTDATVMNYYEQVYSALFCIYTTEFLGYMERNINKFDLNAIDAFKSWLANPNPIYRNEMTEEPPINYTQLISCVSKNYERIKNESKNKNFKDLLQNGFINKLK